MPISDPFFNVELSGRWHRCTIPVAEVDKFPLHDPRVHLAGTDPGDGLYRIDIHNSLSERLTGYDFSEEAVYDGEYIKDWGAYKERAVHGILTHGSSLLSHYRRLHSKMGCGWLEGACALRTVCCSSYALGFMSKILRFINWPAHPVPAERPHHYLPTCSQRCGWTAQFFFYA